MAEKDKLTGEDLDNRAAELEIEGRSDMTADEKRKAIAKAEKQQAKQEDDQSQADEAKPEEPQDGDPVESYDVEAHTDRTNLTLNGVKYRLDTQTLLAVTKLLDAAKVGANF